LREQNGHLKTARSTSRFTCANRIAGAVGPDACSMKDLVLEKAEEHGDYIVCELYHPNTGRIKSVTFQSNEYIYAVSMSLNQGGDGTA